MVNAYLQPEVDDHILNVLYGDGGETIEYKLYF